MRIALRSRFTRPLGMLGLVMAVTSFAACNSERAVGPQADISASFAKGGSTSTSITSSTSLISTTSLITKQALLWKTPIGLPITSSFTVTRQNGGQFTLDQTGLSIQVPPGAISTATLTITVRAISGNAVAYEFTPEGTKFLKPITMWQDLYRTSWASNGHIVRGAGYFHSADQVNTTTGATLLNEVLPAVFTNNWLKWDVVHFSGYMVSMD